MIGSESPPHIVNDRNDGCRRSLSPNACFARHFSVWQCFSKAGHKSPLHSCASEGFFRTQAGFFDDAGTHRSPLRRRSTRCSKTQHNAAKPRKTLQNAGTVPSLPNDMWPCSVTIDGPMSWLFALQNSGDIGTDHELTLS